MHPTIKNPALGVPVAVEVAQELDVFATNAGVPERARYLRRVAVLLGRDR